MLSVKTSKKFLARKRIDILGLLVDEITPSEAVDQIQEWVEQKRLDPNMPGRRIATVNPEYIMAAQHDPDFFNVVNTSAMLTPDGIGVIYAGMFFRTPFRSRVTGVELTDAIARHSAETGLRLFLLGAGPGIAEEAAERLHQLYPGVNIVGCFAGTSGPDGDAETLKRVQAAKPDVVLVAYGMIKQDYWAVRNIEASGAAVTIGVGGTFDYLSGRVPFAPTWIRKMGMEWLYRLYNQPWRWKRDIAMLQFGLAVLNLSFVKLRFGSRRPAPIYMYETHNELRTPEFQHAQSA